MRTDLIPGEWDYVSCHCIVAIGDGVAFTYECAACGNTNLRFIHTLEHDGDKRSILVGVECARALMGDYNIPTLAENETKRKERWRRKYRTPGRCITTPEDLEARGKL